MTIDIIGDNPRRSRYDPNLANEFNKQVEDEERRKKLEERLDARKKPEEVVKPEKVAVSADFDPSQYVLVPEHNVLIAKEATLKEKKWRETHFELAKDGLYMPRIDVFMQHFKNVRDAYSGERSLFNGNNAELSDSELDHLWKYLAFSDGSLCVTWLDALFEDIGLAGRPSQRWIWTNHRTAGNNLVGDHVPLEWHLAEDGVIDLKHLNSQGLPLPTAKSISQKCSAGSSIEYMCPTNGRVAGYSSAARNAYLCCGKDPVKSVPHLGVFACRDMPQKSGENQNDNGK